MVMVTVIEKVEALAMQCNSARPNVGLKSVA